MTSAQFNDLIHASVRLRICGLLSAVDKLDFAVMRDSLGISDATLSKHLKTLADAGYVSSSKNASKDRKDARRLTWLSLTSSGRKAFKAHVAALKEITHQED